MNVAVTDLRAHLREWLARVCNGEEVVVTDRGIPIVRLTAIESRMLIEQLIEEGKISRPSSHPRPVATGRPRPRARRPIADIVSEQRR